MSERDTDQHALYVTRSRGLRERVGLTWDGDVQRVGPKGYTHGWVKVAAAIEQTAAKVTPSADLMGNPRSDRVANFLRLAAKAARDGDHQTALTMLGKAHNDATGASARQHVPPVKLAGGTPVASSIKEHIEAVTAASVSRPATGPPVKKISAAESRRRRQAAAGKPVTSTGY
jgi:hypothetical protein